MGLAEKTAPEYETSLGTLGETAGPAYSVVLAGVDEAGLYVESGAVLSMDTIPVSEAETMTFMRSWLNDTFLANPKYLGTPYFDRFEIWRGGKAIFQGAIKPGTIPTGWGSDKLGGAIYSAHYFEP